MEAIGNRYLIQAQKMEKEEKVRRYYYSPNCI